MFKAPGDHRNSKSFGITENNRLFHTAHHTTSAGRVHGPERRAAGTQHESHQRRRLRHLQLSGRQALGGRGGLRHAAQPAQLPARLHAWSLLSVLPLPRVRRSDAAGPECAVRLTTAPSPQVRRSGPRVCCPSYHCPESAGQTQRAPSVLSVLPLPRVRRSDAAGPECAVRLTTAPSPQVRRSRTPNSAIMDISTSA